MTDFFLALMLPGAGDELQGLKKGLVELADMIAVNKADGDNLARARAAAAEYRAALHILTPALAQLGAAGRDLFGAHRRRHRRSCGRRCSPIATSSTASAEFDGATARAAGQMDVDDARRFLAHPHRLGARSSRPRCRRSRPRSRPDKLSPARAVDELVAALGV